MSKMVQLWALPDSTPLTHCLALPTRLGALPVSVLAPRLTSKSWMVPVKLTL